MATKVMRAPCVADVLLTTRSVGATHDDPSGGRTEDGERVRVLAGRREGWMRTRLPRARATHTRTTLPTHVTSLATVGLRVACGIKSRPVADAPVLSTLVAADDRRMVVCVVDLVDAPMAMATS